jgi:hypothetical protein
MNKKQTIIIILQFLIILILGVLLLKKEFDPDFIKTSENFLRNEIIAKEIIIREMGGLIEEADKDFTDEFDADFDESYLYVPFSHPFMLSRIYERSLSILGLIEDLEKEIAQNRNVDASKITGFSKDNHFYMNESLLSMIELLNNPSYKKHEKQYVLLLIKNYYLQKYILQFDESSIPLAYGQAINYAEQDTVNFGEIYHSQILFNALDAAGNIVVFENGDTVKYGKFEEKALKKGDNHKKGYMKILRRGGWLTYEFDIDYFVK